MTDITLAWLGGIVSWYILHAIWKHAVTGYLAKKGANRADKEDIQHLTKLVESVKADFASHLEEQKSTNQLRVAALEDRLKAHQEAFALWRKMFNAFHTPEIASVVAECERWWENNCLYLEPAAREAFADAFLVARQHKLLLEESRRDDKNSALILERWKTFTDAPQIIISAVALPGLTRAEVKELQKKTGQG